MNQTKDASISEVEKDGKVEYNISISIYDPKTSSYEHHTLTANSKEEAQSKLEQMKESVAQYNKEYEESKSTDPKDDDKTKSTDTKDEKDDDKTKSTDPKDDDESDKGGKDD